MNPDRLEKKLRKRFPQLRLSMKEGVLTLDGQVDSYMDAVKACQMAADGRSRWHVVNDLRFGGPQTPPMRMPVCRDGALEGRRPDVLVIGGGISGTSILRELSRYQLDLLLVEKEADIAMQASGRNDGEVHPGIDLPKGTLKQHYVLLGNRMMDSVCRELDVPFRRCGQYVGMTEWFLLPAAWVFVLLRRAAGVKDARVLLGKRLRKAEPELNPKFRFALYNPSAGCVCPYGLAIAYAENAVLNGAQVSLNTAVTGMDLQDGRIQSVQTNRGTIYPKLVINAAGTFSEEVAAMAGDRFYSIHPRRGTNSILDQKAGAHVQSIVSIKQMHHRVSHTKGGGVLHTVDGNLLVGPDAVETVERENFETRRESVETVFAKQTQTWPELKQRDIITFFTGVRACTFEEDFVIERGRKTKNLIHCAGIQSPGLTTAPAVAMDVAKMAAESLDARTDPGFNPIRKGIPKLSRLSDQERARLIQENPDYGQIVCRCEQVSRGEILDALNAPICVPTVDGIKKRVRPGMGRCQGGFCMPAVMEIIAQHQHIPLWEVKKSGEEAVISYGGTKGGDGQ